MLTGDENIADVKFVVIWQIDPVHPENYAFNISNQRDTVKAVAESAMREVIGRGQIQRILTAERQVIETGVQELMQKVLNGYKAGILVLQVQLQSVDPPEQVIAAFKDVTAAQQDQNRLRNEAEAYANRVVPRPGARPRRLFRRRKATGFKPSPRQPVRFPASTKSTSNIRKPRRDARKTLSRDHGTSTERHGQDHSRSEQRAKPGGRSLFAAWGPDTAR